MTSPLEFKGVEVDCNSYQKAQGVVGWCDGAG